MAALSGSAPLLNGSSPFPVHEFRCSHNISVVMRVIFTGLVNFSVLVIVLAGNSFLRVGSFVTSSRAVITTGAELFYNGFFQTYIKYENNSFFVVLKINIKI